MLNDFAVGPWVLDLMNSALEAKPSGGCAPTRLVASITVLPRRPLTESKTSGAAGPGHAIRTASASPASPPSRPIRWTSCPAFSHRLASPPPTLPLPTTVIFICSPLPGPLCGDHRTRSVRGNGLRGGGLLRGSRDSPGLRAVLLDEVALADQERGQHRGRQGDQRAKQQDFVQAVGEAGAGSTTPTAVEARGTFTKPAPMPATIRPGSRCVQSSLGVIPRVSSSPSPIRANPGPISQRVGTCPVRRPASPAVRKVAPVSGRSRRPVSIAEEPRTFCR